MATLATATRNAACDAVVDKIDDGASAGKLVIKNSGGTTLVTITLNDPAFSDAASGIATLDVTGGISGSPAQTGTASEAELQDSDSNVIIDALSVGTSGADVNLDSLSIQVGVDVTISSASITMPAS